MCNDPSLKYLAELGFNVIRLPRGGIEPGLVLAGKGPELSRLGDLARVWQSPRAMPEPLPKCRAAMLDGKRTESFNVGVGLAIAERILKPVGLDLPKLRLALSDVSSLGFGFGDSQIWSLDLMDVGAFLAKGSLDEDNPVVRHFVLESRPPIHVVVDVLLSDSVSVEVSKNGGGAVELDLGVLQQAVDAKVQLESKSEHSTRVLFKGDDQLAFGFRALKLTYENGAWKVHGQARPGSVFHAREPEPSEWASVFALGEANIATATA